MELFYFSLSRTACGSTLFNLFPSKRTWGFIFVLPFWYFIGAPGWRWAAANCCQSIECNWGRDNSTILKNRCQYSTRKIGKPESAVAGGLQTAHRKKKEVR